MEDFESTRQACQESDTATSAGTLSLSPEVLSSAEVQDSSVQSTMEVESSTPATPESGASGSNEGEGPVLSVSPLLEAGPPMNESVCQVITKFSQLEGQVATECSQETGPPLDNAAETEVATTPPSRQCDAEESLDSTGGFDEPPGIFDCKLVDTSLQEECECPICNMIARKPSKVSCCGQIFCHACISSQTECPICREAFEHCMVDKLLERKVRHLEVYCVNQEQGCVWTGELRDVAQHLQDPTELQLGGTDRCQYQFTTCKKCDQELLYVELSHHVNSVCRYRVLLCEYEFAGCPFRCPEMNMPQHLQESTSTHLALVSKLVREEKAVSSKFKWCYCFTLVALCVGFFVVFSYQQARIDTLEEASSRLLHLMEKNAKHINIDVVDLKSGMMTYVDGAVKYFTDFLP